MLHARDRGCTHPGCTVPGYGCQVHHINGWKADGQTDIDVEVLACGPHNRLAEQEGWQVRIRNDGTVEWIPPPPLDTGQTRTNTYHHPDRILKDPRPRNRVGRRRRLVAMEPARMLAGVHAIGQAVLVGSANRNDPDGVGVLGSIQRVRREIDVKLTMTRLAFLAVGATAPLIMFAPSGSATGVPCPYVTSAPVAQCQTDDGLPGLGNGPSPFEYPVGFPGSL